MGFSYDSSLSWAEKITRLLEELCDLLSDYMYDCASRYDIISKETQLYEIVDEYVPRLLPVLNDFFDYIHECIRENQPLEEEEIENHIQMITNQLHRRDNYIQRFHDFSDERSKYELEIATRPEQLNATEREALYQIINSDQTFDEESKEKIPSITRAERFALIRERKQNIVNTILAFLSKQSYPISIEQIHHNVSGATRQLIEIVRKRPEIIDYKEKLLLGTQLQIEPKEKAILREGINDTFFSGKVHVCQEIYWQLGKTHNNLLTKLHIYNSYSFFSVIHYLFPNDFVYVRPRIALLGNTITKPLESITRYITGRFKTSVKELKEFIEDADYDLTVTLALINKLPDIIMLDRNTLAPKTRLNITEEQLQVITSLIVDELNGSPESNETMAIRDLTCAVQFPILNIPLNEWVLYSILTKWNWPEQDGDQAIFTFATSPHLSRNIPIVSTNETIDKEMRQTIAKAHEGKESSTMSVDDLSKLDELIEDEIEFDWDLEALEEEEDNT